MKGEVAASGGWRVCGSAASDAGGNRRWCYRSTGERIAAPGRDSLVRGARREDQVLPGL